MKPAGSGVMLVQPSGSGDPGGEDAGPNPRGSGVKAEVNPPPPPVSQLPESPFVIPGEFLRHGKLRKLFIVQRDAQAAPNHVNKTTAL